MAVTWDQFLEGCPNPEQYPHCAEFYADMMLYNRSMIRDENNSGTLPDRESGSCGKDGE